MTLSRLESSRGVKARVSASPLPVTHSSPIAAQSSADIEALVNRLVEAQLLSVFGNTGLVRTCLFCM